MIHDPHTRAAETALKEYCLAHQPTAVKTHALVDAVMRLIAARSEMKVRLIVGDGLITRNGSTMTDEKLNEIWQEINNAAVRKDGDRTSAHLQFARALLAIPTPVPPIALAGEPDALIRHVLVSLDCAAQWLENGCDPKCAAGEIRLNMAHLQPLLSPTPSTQAAGESVAWRAELSRIADDYQPDGASQAILALEEMRQALRELLDAAPTPSASSVPVAEGWLPTAANINALPEPIRDYIMGLETNADPAGMVRENAVLRHDNAEFESRLAANPAPSALTDEQITDSLQSAGVRWHWIGADHAVMSTVGSTSAKTIIAGVRALLQSTGEPK